MKRSGTSFRGLALAVILPLVVLAVIAAMGTRAQFRGAWAGAREEAQLAADRSADLTADFLTKSVRETAAFPDPPLPGPAAADDDPLLGDRLEDLQKVRDDPAAGLSPAGLPRRVMAAIRVLEKTRTSDDAEITLRLATVETPSILSGKIIETVEAIVPGITASRKDQWQLAADAHAALLQNPDAGPNGKFLPIGTSPSGNEKILWLAEQDGKIRFVHAQTIIDLPRPAIQSRSTLPWAGARLLHLGNTVWESRAGSRSKSPPPILAEAQIPFGEGLKIQMLAIKPDLILANARSQARWSYTLLSFAFVTSITGLWLIHRVLDRERKLNALKSDFVASVSHELRAPIASIRLMADALEAGKIEGKTAGEFHRLISREGARLSTLIENVLDFAKIEQGRKQWHFEETDLREVLVSTVSLMEPLAGEKDMRLEIEQLPPSALASIDADAIRQALVNLLDNAIKFSPRASVVKISLIEMPATKQLRIEISDGGPGIPRADQQRIFEKFHRLGSELRRETQGTGIGLSLVKSIAEAHGGGITLESESGKGSTFILSLPAA